MGILVVWLWTVLASFGMQLSQEMTMFKDAADNGYKIDMERLEEFGEQLTPNAKKATLFSFLIPFANIIMAIQRTMQYNISRATVLEQLRVMDILLNMTDEEIAAYQKKPTCLNSIIINLKSEADVHNYVKKVSFIDGREESVISYREDEESNRIIVNVKGPAAELSIIEQYAKIDEILHGIGKSIKEKLKDDEFISMINDGLSKGQDLNLNLSNLPDRSEPVKKQKTNYIDLSLSERHSEIKEEDLIDSENGYSKKFGKRK